MFPVKIMSIKYFGLIIMKNSTVSIDVIMCFTTTNVNKEKG